MLGAKAAKYKSPMLVFSNKLSKKSGMAAEEYEAAKGRRGTVGTLCR